MECKLTVYPGVAHGSNEIEASPEAARFFDRHLLDPVSDSDTVIAKTEHEGC